MIITQHLRAGYGAFSSFAYIDLQDHTACQFSDFLYFLLVGSRLFQNIIIARIRLKEACTSGCIR